MIIECGRHIKMERCVLANGHDGKCSPRLDTVEEVEYRGTWLRLTGPWRNQP